jgi:hypothetical protein
MACYNKKKFGRQDIIMHVSENKYAWIVKRNMCKKYMFLK